MIVIQMFKLWSANIFYLCVCIMLHKSLIVVFVSLSINSISDSPGVQVLNILFTLFFFYCCFFFFFLVFFFFLFFFFFFFKIFSFIGHPILAGLVMIFITYISFKPGPSCSKRR